MKRLILILLANLVFLPIFCQKYSAELKNEMSDSLYTNPEYVMNWCEGEINKGEKHPYVYVVRAMCYSLSNDYESYVNDISKAIKFRKNGENISASSLYYMRGLGYLGLGNKNKALKDFNKSIKLDPFLVDSYEQRVEIYFMQGKYELARKDIENIIEIEPTYENLLLLARCDILEGDLDVAIETLNVIINGDKDIIDAYLYRSGVYKNQQKNKLAINDYIMYIALSESFNVEYLAELSKNDFDYTISILSDGIANESDNFRWLLARMCLYTINEQYDLASEDLELFKNTFGEEMFEAVKGSYYYEKIMENTK